MDSSGSIYDTMTGSCSHGKEPTNSGKDVKFLSQLSDSQLILYYPTDALNYINCRIVKNTLKI